jgi:hypothetical protein
LTSIFLISTHQKNMDFIKISTIRLLDILVWLDINKTTIWCLTQAEYFICYKSLYFAS